MRRRHVENMSTPQLFDQMRADYAATKTSRHRRNPTGISPMGSGADYHYRTGLGFFRMIELARSFYRVNPVIAQGVRRLIYNVLQTGFTLDPQTGNEKADTELSQRWKAWSESADACELSGRLNFHQVERLVLQHTIVDGDVLVLPLKDGHLQLVEAHRLRSPSNAKQKRAGKRALVHGVLIDEYRRPLEYWLTKDDIDPCGLVAKVSDITPYKARDKNGRRQVLHIYRPDRVSQTRGVTAFAPVVDTVSMGDDLFFAMLVKAQHSWRFSYSTPRKVPSAHGEARPIKLVNPFTRSAAG